MVEELERLATQTGLLARLGFAEPTRAAELLDAVDAAGLAPSPELLTDLGQAADPDLALRALHRLLQTGDTLPTLATVLQTDPSARRRLALVLGASSALGDHLAAHPMSWTALCTPSDRAPTWLARRLALLDAIAKPDGDRESALVSAYRDALLDIAARDLAGEADVVQVGAELADLAAATLEAALALARAEVGPQADRCKLAVIGMGKCGGRELNYVSDIDVVFVAEPVGETGDDEALRVATRLAGALIRLCAPIWQVDAALRPEGKSGPLVRTLASHLAYYQRWAKTWEFQALLKARPVAGDLELGRAYVAAVTPLVWQAADREHFVEDVQAMRRRVEENIPEKLAGREIKLGRGGLRDVEFAVQLLQLVHGRTDESLRSPHTLTALRALAAGGYVGRADARDLDEAYRFLRTLEHRLQLFRLRRTHSLPTDDTELRRLGRALGFRRDPVGELQAAYAKCTHLVRRLHEKLFYRPLLSAVARLGEDDARLAPQAAVRRLAALGYADPQAALRHIEALTAGVSRRAAIQRTLLPVLLGWFADAPDPDAGLLAFRRLSDALGDTPWYLRFLRDEGAAAQHLARILATSRYAVDLLARAPESVAMLADSPGEGPYQLRPRRGEELRAELLAAVRRHDDPTVAVDVARGLRRRELFRIACADILGLLDVTAVGEALTDITEAILDAVLDVVSRAMPQQARLVRLAVIGMGRLGGREQGYGSDADVLFVHEPLPGTDDAPAAAAAHEIANELRRLLARPAPEPPVEVDADLRPEGRQGPLTRSLESFLTYYERWSEIWEAQALLKARVVAGDRELGERFISAIDPIRFPAGGIDAAAAREIRRIKARVEKERLPRGTDPALHTKLGRGGLADIEWTAQFLQLQHAHRIPTLRTTSTLGALHAAAQAQVIDPADASTLADAWQLVTKVRNALVLVRGRPTDTIPTVLRDLVGVARLVGYAASQPGDFLDLYRRVTRRARAVVERVFYP
ncbi:MAG: bifunctional [glutamine synthetase] adenylyltransferase/[glutamine synthetase]-adenylyl-L-tyrosine phosphorylase [Acidothermus sp.]|nr:bifunctional [glutamine synthetase] adenylyltransferase/[glutamine synthetase]-adenylyl-L-tyrosine phosphorylase [Acidothermus sp.]